MLEKKERLNAGENTVHIASGHLSIRDNQAQYQ